MLLQPSRKVDKLCLKFLYILWGLVEKSLVVSLSYQNILCMNRAKQPTAGPDQPNSHSIGIVKKSVWNKGNQNSFLQFATTRWMEIICLICDGIDVAAGCVTSLRSLMVMMRMFTKKKTRKIYHPSIPLSTSLSIHLFICFHLFVVIFSFLLVLGVLIIHTEKYSML